MAGLGIHGYRDSDHNNINARSAASHQRVIYRHNLAEQSFYEETLISLKKLNNGVKSSLSFLFRDLEEVICQRH